MNRSRPSHAAKLLLAAALAWLISELAHGQSFTAVVQGYTLPQNAKAFILLASPTNEYNPAGIAWSGTNAIPFTASQVWSTFGTNEAYGAPADLSIEVEMDSGIYSALTPMIYFNPAKYTGTNNVIDFAPSNAVPNVNVLQSTNPPSVTVFGTNSIHVTIQATASLNPTAWFEVTNFDSTWGFSATTKRSTSSLFIRAGVSPSTNIAPTTWSTNQ